jgi:hypothetical protein
LVAVVAVLVILLDKVMLKRAVLEEGAMLTRPIPVREHKVHKAINRDNQDHMDSDIPEPDMDKLLQQVTDTAEAVAQVAKDDLIMVVLEEQIL